LLRLTAASEIRWFKVPEFPLFSRKFTLSWIYEAQKIWTNARFVHDYVFIFLIFVLFCFVLFYSLRCFIVLFTGLAVYNKRIDGWTALRNSRHRLITVYRGNRDFTSIDIVSPKPFKWHNLVYGIRACVKHIPFKNQLFRPRTLSEYVVATREKQAICQHQFSANLCKYS